MPVYSRYEPANPRSTFGPSWIAPEASQLLIESTSRPLATGVILSTIQDLLQQFAKLVAVELHQLQMAPAPKPESSDRLLTTQEAAEILSVHSQTLRGWKGQGCPCVTLSGGRLRWQLSVVRTWLATRE